MKIKIINYGYKKLPFRAHANDAGADVHICLPPGGYINLPPHTTAKMPLGLGLVLPDGYMACVYPRSGLSSKGIVCELPPIDSGYRGEIHAIVHNGSDKTVTFADGELAWTSFQKTAKCFDYPYFGTNGVDENKIHPTQKPVALYAWLLKNYAKSGDRIFDPMMGSQSRRIAAYKMGFDYVGCELDKEYYLKGCERFKKECLGISKTKSGKTIIEQQIFE